MRKLFFCLLAALSVPGWADITLVRDGIPVSVIVLQPKATKSAQLGAAELQHHVKLIMIQCFWIL